MKSLFIVSIVFLHLCRLANLAKKELKIPYTKFVANFGERAENETRTYPTV